MAAIFSDDVLLHPHDAFRLGHLRFRNREAHGLYVLRLNESRLNLPQGFKRANHETGGDEQHNGQPHLNDHQRVLRSVPLAALARRPAAAPQHPVESPGYPRPCVLDDRDHAEEQARRERHRQCERQYHRVNRDFAETGKVRRSHRGQKPEPAVGDRQSTRAAQDSERDALDQQLVRDVPAPGAQRRANRELLLASFRSHQQEIGDVGAGDQQHDADGAHQHPQHLTHIAHHILLHRPKRRREARGLQNGTVGSVLRDPDRQHPANISAGLRERDAWLQPGDAHVHVDIIRLELRSREALGQNHFRIRAQKPEPLRHDADDFSRPRVDRDRPPDHSGVRAEPALPVSMRQDHRLRRARRIVRRWRTIVQGLARRRRREASRASRPASGLPPALRVR